MKVFAVSKRGLILFLLTTCLAVYLNAGCLADLAYLLSVDEMTAEADAILVGTVESISHHPADPNDVPKIHRRVLISVEHDLKNSLNSSKVTILALGATFGNSTIWVEDQPEFNVSERVLLFLRDDPWFLDENPDCFYQVLGECQGKFTVEGESAFSELGLVVYDGDELHGIKFELGATPPPLPTILSDLCTSPFVAASSEHPSGILHENANKLGDDVTINFTITNTDSQPLVYTATLRIENITLTIDVELGPYESKTVSHTMTPDAAGYYLVEVDGLTGGFYVWPLEVETAEFSVSRLRYFKEVEEGADITMFVNVSNVGRVEGTHQLDLMLDGEAVYSINVTLPVGASEEVPLFIEDGLTGGTYQVEVEGITGSFTVKSEPSLWDEIPGFPCESITAGLIAAILTLWCTRAAATREADDRAHIRL